MLVAARTASAGSLADALARHAPADVDALRAQLPGDASIRCTLGAIYAKRGDLSRAGIYLTDCEDAALPAELGEPIRKVAIETHRKLRDSDLAVLEIVTKPTGMMAEISALPGDPVLTPATVWIAAGSYEVKATLAGRTIANHVTTTAHSRSVVFLEDKAPAAPVVKAGKADFTDEAEPEDRHTAPPPPIKHGSLMSNKLRGVADPAAAGPQLDDPLALVDDPPPPVPPAMRLGLRAGGGSASHTGGSRLGPSLALEGHLVLAGDARPLELVARADWSRRGGDDAKLDALGATAGVAKVLAAPDTAWLSAGLGLRAEHRFGDAMTTVSANGVGAVASVELALRRLPVVVGARYEQGLTALVDGNHERAVILEVGFDLRAF
jgi:hypothetical protein